ncbi:MAG: ASCH domain-containing protein [Burkholderiaceae bacterium]|jgi:uncharacterized protein YhfF|nr:ASCH domain-containing protein [Burkholderiaceae bacterium]
MSPAALHFWEEFKNRATESSELSLYESFYFGDSAEMARELGELVVSGKKKATASSAWAFEAEGRAPPKVGDLSLVTDWTGNPMCIIETTSIEQVSFKEVSEEFAREEGEGDGSLEFWREAHTAFFERDCQRMGRQFHREMPVVCERFRVVALYAPSVA